METLKQDISFSIKKHDIDVFEQLLQGSESQWWPERMMMKFTNLTGDIKEGTLYLQKAKFPLGPSWHKRNDIIDREKRYLRRTFLDGMFEGGYEEFFVEQNQNQVNIVYHFCYELKGRCSRIIWDLVYKQLHLMNVQRVLNALKQYCEANQ